VETDSLYFLEQEDYCNHPAVLWGGFFIARKEGEMKIETLSGIVYVTKQQHDWLESEGCFLDMSKYPQALPCFNGSEAELRRLLRTMPKNWAPTGGPYPTTKKDWILFATIAAALAFLLIVILI
jgi:hypothetical protein